jgi:hypothetical protein
VRKISLCKCCPPRALDAARGGADKDKGHSTKDFENVHDFWMVFATLRVVTRLIFPWNYCVEALDIKASPNKLLFIVHFADRILHLNAERRDDEKKILQQGQLKFLPPTTCLFRAQVIYTILYKVLFQSLLL